MFKRAVSCFNCDAEQRRTRKQLSGNNHQRLLGILQLMRFRQDLPPFGDLFGYVDLYWADIGTASIQGAGVWKPAEFPCTECWVLNQTNRSGIGGAITQASASVEDWACVQTCAAADALQRSPELLHSQARGSAVIHQHNMHLATGQGCAKMGCILCDQEIGRASCRERGYIS